MEHLPQFFERNIAEFNVKPNKPTVASPRNNVLTWRFEGKWCYKHFDTENGNQSAKACR